MNKLSVVGFGRFVLTMLFCVLVAEAQQSSGGTRLQIFLRVDGSVPDWAQVALSGTRLELEGSAISSHHYSLTAAQGSGNLIILRSAAGSDRFLVGTTIPPGRVNQIRMILGAANVTLSNAGNGPQVLPLVVTSGKLMLKPPSPLDVNAGETRSLVVTIGLGTDALLKKGALSLPPTLRAAMLAAPAPENFLNGSETLQSSISENLPELGIDIVRAKVLDTVAGDVRDLTLLGGAPVSFTDLRDQNETLWRSLHGSLDPALVQRLSSLSIGAPVFADVWLRIPGLQTFQSDAQTAEAWDVAHAAYVNQQHAAATPIAATVSAALTAAGATILSTELSPPVLHIQASRGVLESTAAHLGDVLEVLETQSPLDRHNLMTNAVTDLAQQPLQLAHLLGGGQGLRIAITEDGVCVSTGHEVFQGVTWEAPLDECRNQGQATDGPAFNGGHSTAVAGALAGFVPPTAQGSSNNTRPPTGLVGLFQGRLFTADLCGNITDRLLTRSPHLVNVSCVSGQLVGPVDRGSKIPYDYAVFHDRVFVASGAGNINTSDDQTMQYVLCPSYNAVCVGGYSHNDTLGPGNFGDDSPTERFLNDPATGREKPDLVGPSSGILPLYKCPPEFPQCMDQPASFQFPNSAYERRNGTSFSTPFVVGTAALMMANFPEYLVGNPTLTRAVLMASARHSFPGLPAVPIFNDGIDDKTGAGAPRGDRAKEILSNQQFFPPPDPASHKVSGYVDRNVDFNSAGNLSAPISFIVEANDRVRVVLTYDQCQSDTVSLNDSLIADLDLIVAEDAATVHRVHANNSHLDNTEIVEFTTDVKSQITVKTKAQFWNVCADGTRKTFMAIAWDVLHASEQ